MPDMVDSPDVVSEALYYLSNSDPEGRLVDSSAYSEEDIAQIGQLMTALARLRDAERALSQASLEYMQLNRNDMRALHYLIAAKNRGVVVTPGAIAAHLKISTASTTKLLDRLEQGGHITREPHPTDRRALAIAITPETHEAALHTVGRQQAKRFYAAARLDREERATVIRFLNDMTGEITTGTENWARKGAGDEGEAVSEEQAELGSSE